MTSKKLISLGDTPIHQGGEGTTSDSPPPEGVVRGGGKEPIIMAVKNRRFLPVVEMTNSLGTTSNEVVCFSVGVRRGGPR